MFGIYCRIDFMSTWNNSIDFWREGKMPWYSYTYETAKTVVPYAYPPAALAIPILDSYEYAWKIFKDFWWEAEMRLRRMTDPNYWY